MSGYAVPIGLPRRRRIITPAEWLREKIEERNRERETTISKAIAWRANGALAANAGSGNIAPALPAGHALNDILLLLTCAFDNVACSVSGWTSKVVLNSGTTCRVELWYLRDNGSVSAPTVTHTAGGQAAAFIAAYSGAITTGDPFRDAQAQASSTTTCTAPALTGVVSGDMRLALGGFAAGGTSGGTSNNWGLFTGFAERADLTDVSGANGISVALDDLLASGAAGSVTSTIAWTGEAQTNVGIQAALIPVAVGGGQTFKAIPFIGTNTRVSPI